VLLFVICPAAISQTSKQKPLGPHTLRIIQKIMRIYDLLDTHQPVIRPLAIVQPMRLRGAQFGVHIVQVPPERSPWYSILHSAIQPTNKVDRKFGTS